MFLKRSAAGSAICLKEGKTALPVSVNVSRLQFYDPDFVKRYVEIRDKYHIPPQLLEIEFTESIAFDNTGFLLAIVKSLKANGFSCSIDDFGKGYSSLSLLKELPVDVLKIDSYFFWKAMIIPETWISCGVLLSWCISLISVRSQKELKFLNRWST